MPREANNARGVASGSMCHSVTMRGIVATDIGFCFYWVGTASFIRLRCSGLRLFCAGSYIRIYMTNQTPYERQQCTLIISYQPHSIKQNDHQLLTILPHSQHQHNIPGINHFYYSLHTIPSYPPSQLRTSIISSSQFPAPVSGITHLHWKMKRSTVITGMHSNAANIRM